MADQPDNGVQVAVQIQPAPFAGHQNDRTDGERSAQDLQLLQRVAELERIVGQKQLEIDFLNKLMGLATEELGRDVKKNTAVKLSSGSGGTSKPTGTG